MQKFDYPILYYFINETTVLGMLPGTGFQVVEKDLKTVKAVLGDYLLKQYKKNGLLPGRHLSNAKIVPFDVTVRPSYSENAMQYPMAGSLDLRLYAVTGNPAESELECYIPWLEERFAVSQDMSRQVNALLQYTAETALRQLSPEEIFKLKSYDKPGLDRITLRVNTQRSQGWGGFGFKRSYPTLEQLTEQMPMRRPKVARAAVMPESAWEMEDVVGDLAERIAFSRANVIVTGSPGSGKSTVLLSAVRQITRNMKNGGLQLSFWRMMAQRITAGSKYLGEWQETCETLIEELQACSGVLWVPDAAQLLLSGGSGPEDSVAAFMQPFLQNGRLQLVGEATPQEVESMKRKLPGFTECFQIIRLPELSEKKVHSILERFAAMALQQQNITIQPDALKLAWRILHRYYPYEQFPGKGVRFLSRCVGDAVISESTTITPADVVRQFVHQTGFPEMFLRDDMLMETEELARFFQQRIKGQEAAIQRLCRIIKVFKTGLNNPHKPIANLLFAGPTGVGKTAAAKALADYFFGKGRSQTPLVRLDMSEFQSAWQIGRLIGDGREPGQLVREIRERPFSVLLLDEVEKADPAVFDALLNALDEGILTDAAGRITNFRNTIIIMTTNLGANNGQPIGFAGERSASDNTRAAILKHFRPEFVNRIDDIVVFEQLSKDHIRAIAERELEEFARREGFTAKSLQLTFSERVAMHLTDTGFDPVYGARPLQRALEREVAAPLAAWLLKRPKLQDATLRIDFDGELKVVVSKQ